MALGDLRQISKVKGTGDSPSLRSLNEEVRRLWEYIYYLEGRNGRSTWRDVTNWYPNPEGVVSSANRGAVFFNKDTKKLRVSENAGSWVDLVNPQRVFNARDFGAKGDGFTDDSAAIGRALTAAAPVTNDPLNFRDGGVVVLPTGMYRISRGLVIPGTVSLVGLGVVEFRPTQAIDRMITVLGTGLVSFWGQRFGAIENIVLDGNELANIGLYVGQCSQRTFNKVSVFHCLDTGCQLNNTQNCFFSNCDFEQNGTAPFTTGAGLRLSYGAANNVFIRCELADNGPYQLFFGDISDAPDGVNFGTTPNLNTFFRCQFEQHAAVAAPRTDLVNSIRLLAGNFNTFQQCNVSQIFPPNGTTRNLIQFATSNGVGITTANNQFFSCSIEGSNSGGFLTRAIAAGNVTAGGASFRGTFSDCSFTNHTVLALVDDFSYIELFRPLINGVTTNFLSNGGVKNSDQTININDPETFKVYFSGPRGISIGAPNVDGFNCFIQSGNGSPAGVVAAPVGSLYLRADGGAATTLYVKEGGGTTTAGWVAK